MSCTLWLQRTALHASARKGHLDVVRKVISCGADAGNLSIDTVSAVNAPIWCHMKSLRFLIHCISALHACFLLHLASRGYWQ